MPPVMIPFEWMHVLATMGAAAAAQQQQQTMAVPATAVYNQLSPTPQASSPNFIKVIIIV